MVTAPFTIAAQQFRNRCPLERRDREFPGGRLHNIVHIADRSDLAEAADLITRFGDYAASEAQLRASRSRDLGNYVHFCRWREVERMIGTLRHQAAAGPLH